MAEPILTLINHFPLSFLNFHHEIHPSDAMQSKYRRETDEDALRMHEECETHVEVLSDRLRKSWHQFE